MYIVNLYIAATLVCQSKFELKSLAEQFVQEMISIGYNTLLIENNA